jgi:hypothetical protein
LAQKILIKRGTTAQLSAAGLAGTLNAGEPYLVTDTGQFAIGYASAGYYLFSPLTGFTTSSVTGLGVGATITAGNANSVAIGNNTAVSSPTSTAIGGATINAASGGGVAIGSLASITTPNGVAIGASAGVQAAGCVAIGGQAVVPTGFSNSVAIGFQSRASSTNEFAIGNPAASPTPILRRLTGLANATAPNDAINLAQFNAASLVGVTSSSVTTLGVSASVAAGNVTSTAIGTSAVVSSGTSVAVGANSAINATSPASVALGYNSSVPTNMGDSVALGANSVVNAAHTVSVGNGGAMPPLNRRITNVADGSGATDAATWGQVQAAIAAGGSGSQLTGVTSATFTQLGVTQVVDQTATGSSAVGRAVTIGANATNSTALGDSATIPAGAVDSVAIGHGSRVDAAWQVSFGNSVTQQYRRLTNILGGSANTDAASYGQVLAIANTIPPAPIINTSANLASTNPVLLSGQFAYDSSNSLLKVGNGTTAYNTLSYVTVNSLPHTKITVSPAVAGQVLTVQASGMVAPRDAPVVFTSKGVWGAATTNKVVYTDSDTSINFSLTFAATGQPTYSLVAYVSNTGLNPITCYWRNKISFTNPSPTVTTQDGAFSAAPLAAAGSAALQIGIGQPGGPDAQNYVEIYFIDSTHARAYTWEIICIPNPQGAADGANILMTSKVTRTIL